MHDPTNAAATAPTSSGIKEAWHSLSRCLERLLHKYQDVNIRLDELQNVESLLATLPLASDHFALAHNRLTNAGRYLRSSEIGAARYELRMLKCAIDTLLVLQVPVEPRRRLRRSVAE